MAGPSSRKRQPSDAAVNAVREKARKRQTPAILGATKQSRGGPVPRATGSGYNRTTKRQTVQSNPAIEDRRGQKKYGR